MRTIDSKSYEADGARLTLTLVEQGKTLPFRVIAKHKNKAGDFEGGGTLAAVETEAEGREQFDFHAEKASSMGWSPALRFKLLESVPPPSKRCASSCSRRAAGEAWAAA